MRSKKNSLKKKVPKRYKNKVHGTLISLCLSKLTTIQISGTKEIKIAPVKPLGGQEIKNRIAERKHAPINFKNLIFSNSIAINCFNLLQI
jgi:hypothetical protein